MATNVLPRTPLDKILSRALWLRRSGDNFFTHDASDMTRYVRSAAIEAAPLGDEAILYDPRAKRFCQLNETAACVWDQLQQASTAGEIATRLRSRFAAGSANVEGDVAEALRTLSDLALIEAAGA